MSTSRAGAESARRAIELMFAFGEQPVSSIRDLSESVGIPTPTVHRYISLLREMGVVEEAGRGQYRLTLRTAALARAARSATTIIDTISPAMTALADALGESVLLIQPIGDVMVCTHRVEVHRHLRLSFEVGQQLPALRGASARLHAGSMPPERRRAYVDAMIERGESPPVRGVPEFLAAAERDTAQGWAMSADEIDDGVSALACPLYDDREMIATLSVAVPTARATPERMLAVREEALAHARAVSAALGRGDADSE